MKTIKDLTVELRYKVGLVDVKVPDDVYEGLLEIEREGYNINNLSDNGYAADEWLKRNIKERDAYEWSYEVEL